MKKFLSEAVLVFSAILLMAGFQKAYAAGLHVTGQAGDLKVQVMMDKTPAEGRNTVRVRLTDRTGRPVTDALVRVYWMMPAMGTMPSMKGFADAARADSEYRAAMDLESSGEWHSMVKVKHAGRLLPPVRFDVDVE
ncbi:MAG: FixH family protein [Nitrospiraceae bacterium]|nr:FixH family protein [Nitrospiraceae bacterium]